MVELPGPVEACVYDYLVANLAVAYLGVDAAGLVTTWGGNLDRYGVEGVGAGCPACQVAPFLEGLLPLAGVRLQIPEAQLSSDCYAQVHLVPGDGLDWVVLLDCTDLARACQLVRQRGNDLALARGAPVGAGPGDGGEARVRDLSAEVVRTVGLAILVPVGGARFRVETAPPWLASLAPGLAAGDEVDVSNRFPYLDSFLSEAESLWSQATPGFECSGIWVERGADGVEVPVEAIAVVSSTVRLLVLRTPWSEYLEKRTVLTRARSSVLEHDRLQREVEKKETLVRCIVHDLANPLAGIKGALDLVRRAPLTEPMDRYVGIALKLCDDQQRLIRSILDGFSAELGPGDVRALKAHEVADAMNVLLCVYEKLAPSFSMRDVALALSGDDAAGPGRVAIDAASLERVLLNLAENALRHSPSGSVVTLRVRRQAASFVFSVEDCGPGLSPDLEGRLFQRFSQGDENRGAVGLGLYFCRITAERWHGSVGHENRPGGGSSFWVSLPAYEEPGGLR